MNIKRGEIHLAALDPTIGREIAKTRPVVIVSKMLTISFPEPLLFSRSLRKI